MDNQRDQQGTQAGQPAMAQPADPMTSAMPQSPATDSMSAPAAAGPASLDDVMAELRKIEDKLVEMNEKL